MKLYNSRNLKQLQQWEFWMFPDKDPPTQTSLTKGDQTRINILLSPEICRWPNSREIHTWGKRQTNLHTTLYKQRASNEMTTSHFKCKWTPVKDFHQKSLLFLILLKQSAWSSLLSWTQDCQVPIDDRRKHTKVCGHSCLHTFVSFRSRTDFKGLGHLVPIKLYLNPTVYNNI